MEKAKNMLLADAIASAIEAERTAIKYKRALFGACVFIACLLLRRG